MVKIEDKAAYVNIRKKPTTSSQNIGKARDGDTFECIAWDQDGMKLNLQ